MAQFSTESLLFQMGSNREWKTMEAKQAEAGIDNLSIMLPQVNIQELRRNPFLLISLEMNAFYNATNANQGGEVGFRQFIAMAVGETGTGLNGAESAGIGSSMINRMNQAGTSLNDPNWIKKISYGGNVNTNLKILMHPNEDYREIMSTKYFPTVQSILNSTNPGIQGAVKAYLNWGTDYSNLRGFADTGLYYWNASRSLSNSTFGTGVGYINTGVQGDMVTRKNGTILDLTTTFYRPN